MSKVIEKLKNVGPGALVAAGFVGPGTVTTCTVSGASVGYTMLWALVFATVATIIFQEMAARVGIASQKGLGENIRDRIPNPVLKGLAIAIVIIAIFIGNVAYETGNITGGILGIQAVAPGIPMGAIVSGMFTPQLPTNNSTGLMTAIGLVGTTIVPYNLFLHASSAAERWKDPEQISDARFDAVLSIALGGIISMAILICAAANLHPLWTTWEVDGATVAGITTAAGDQIASAKINGQVMALALTPLLGDWSTWMIGLGLLAAGFSSAITAPLSAAYAVNGVLGWGKGLKDAKFKIVWAIVLVCGCCMAIAWGKSPTQLILVAQAANAILLPIMAFFVIFCANGKDLGKFKNHAFANIAGVIIIVVTLFICYRNMTNFLTSLQTLIGM